ncbi:MAG: hypothetical protein KBS97_01060 [Firmicutes bacterium]|nr:hypothetical protein [Candidatus Fiminaster equi]
MGLLFALILLLVLAVVFFITYPILSRKIITKKYDVFCAKKIKTISTKNGYKFLTDLSLSSFNKLELGIDHIIFGKKYIYILTNYMFDGDIKGASDNNSWILKKSHNQGSEYIDNISLQLSEKRGVFSSKIAANPELIIPVAIVNNNCEIRVEGINNNSTFVIHYSSLKKLIKKLESRDVANLDEEQVEIQYQNIKNENEEK